MKKLLTVLTAVLVLSMILSLAGCGKQAPSSVDLVINDAASSTQVISQSPLPAPTPSSAPESETESAVVIGGESAPAAASKPASEVVVSAAPASSAASGSIEKVSTTPATAGLPVLPVLGVLLVVCLYGLLREMRKKY